MSDIALQVENISKKYQLGGIGAGTLYETLSNGLDRLRGRNGQSNGEANEFWALKDINFEVKQGEVVGIIGKNGAGKSTLLKVLSRITEPTTGQIKLGGRIASLLEVGTGFHPELSGRENIFLNGSILGMTREEIKRKFDEIVDFSGVEKFLDTPVKRYSSGMYVRLAFAVAAHLEPEILVIDEVLAVGDAEFQKKCLGKMQDVAGQGRTVLFVSHNMGAVQKLCSRVILIQQGELEEDGPPQSVIGSYLGENGNQKQVTQWVRPSNTAARHPRLPVVEWVKMTDEHDKEKINFMNYERPTFYLSISATGWNYQWRIVVDILNQAHELLIRTGHNDVKELFDKEGRKNTPENIICKLQLPAYLLNEGSYWVTVRFGDSVARKWLDVQEDILSFVVDFDLENENLSHSKRKGIIAPMVDWELVEPNTLSLY